MEAMTYVLDDRVWTRQERDGLPADGHRYELVDGALVVTPAPHWRHQRASFRLGLLLEAARPQHLEVLAAPTDVTLAGDTVVEPDLLVAERSGLDGDRPDVVVVPLLVVEILSASTQVIDRNLKRRRYEAAGIASYWLLDLEGPTLTALQLDGTGVYTEVARVSGTESWTATSPFDVTVTPLDLLA
jgi:Uma2 family endonuclease